jgi:two-component system, cell cycle sensor histidine kinase and response regulator CckA
MGEQERIDELQAEVRRLRARLSRLEGRRSALDSTQEMDLVNLALDQAPCGAVVASTSASGRIVYVNREFTAITGYTRDDVPTVARWLERAYPDPRYRGQVMGNWERDVREPGRDVIYVVRCKDGRDRDILLRSAMVPGGYMVVTLLDLTAMRRAQAELAVSERRFRELTETIDQVFWIVELEPPRVAYASPAFERIWGRPVEDIYADFHLWSSPIHPDDQAASVEAFGRVLAGEQNSFVLTYRIIRPDGSMRWIEDLGVPVRDDLGRVLRVTGIAKDVTRRVAAERARRDSEERWRLLVESMPTALAVHREGRILWANSAALELVGARSVDDVVGRELADFIHPDQRRASSARIRAIYEEGRVPSAELRLLRMDGSTVVANAAGSAIIWEGEPAGQSVMTDLSERRRAETERQALGRRVQEAQRMESLAVLAGGVAHDFNNLLVGILGNADLARRELDPGSPADACLEGIDLAARRAADLARQMLAYSGRGHFVVEPLELDTMLREIGGLLETSISKKATLQLELAPDLPPVRADATQLRQVMMNLITNASEAIGERGGVIAVTTGLSRDVRTPEGLRFPDEELPEGLYCFVEVSDTGEGMDQATTRRVFDPFFTTKFTGRGLGLAAVLGIAKGHGGAIEVASAVGRGSTFRLLLPALPDPMVKPEGTPRPDRRRTQRAARVLLIDDEEIVRSVGASMLESAGYQVVVAEDGQAALEIFSASPDEVDVVLLDLSMPRMDGQETFAALKALRPDLRVVLTSGYNEQEAVDRFTGQGLAGFVQKPYRLADLVRAIEQAH